MICFIMQKFGMAYFNNCESGLNMLMIVEFYARKIQIFPLLQRWSSVRGCHGCNPTHVVQEDARKGKTVAT